MDNFTVSYGRVNFTSSRICEEDLRWQGIHYQLLHDFTVKSLRLLLTLYAISICILVTIYSATYAPRKNQGSPRSFAIDFFWLDIELGDLGFDSDLKNRMKNKLTMVWEIYSGS